MGQYAVLESSIPTAEVSQVGAGVGGARLTTLARICKPNGRGRLQVPPSAPTFWEGPVIRWPFFIEHPLSLGDRRPACADPGFLRFDALDANHVVADVGATVDERTGIGRLAGLV